jgi:serine/threonine-protein kinase
MGAGTTARAVAIEKLHAQFAEDADFVATFLDEARLAARVQHPNVVPTLDIVRQGKELVRIREYVTGETLAQLTGALRAAGKRLDRRIGCAVLVGALYGLHAAHEAKNEFSESLGIVHGNVSPENILVGVDGVPRLVGFGVARAVVQMRDALGRAIKGKLAYMAPEQVRGATATRAADVWAAAKVLWEVLTGELLFDVDDDAALAQAILGSPIRDPSEMAPGVPAALDAIVQKGLERDPKRRFATAREMAEAIEQALPLATPADVGACVERACGDALKKRAESVHEAESTPMRRSLPAASIVPSGEFIADALWGDQGKSGQPAAPPSGSVRPAVLAQVLVKPPSLSTGGASAARRWILGAAGLVIVGLFVFVAGLLLIPGYAKRRAIATAAARGVSLTIDDAAGGFGGITFQGVTAIVPDVPGARATIAELEIELRWLRPERATLRGAELSLDGPFSKTLAIATLWYRGHDTEETREGAPRVRVVVPSAHVLWSHAFGEDGQIDAANVTGELTPTVSTRIGDEFQFTTSTLTLKSKAGTFGPWRVDFDRDPDALNARIAFDPPVPDGPSALVTRMTTGKTSIEVNVPRSPLVRIGIPLAVLSDFRHVPDQAEIKLHYVQTPDGRTDATLTTTLFGLRMPPFAGPVDVKVAGSVAGSASGPLDLQGGVLSVGPVRATLAGPVVIADSVRATLAWKATPIPCAQLLPKSDHAANDLANQLGALGAGGGDLTSMGLDVTALAQAAGLARVGGNLSASGTLVFDSSDLAGTAFAASGKNSCGISLFAGR